MEAYTTYLFAILAVVGGVIAWLGDVIGARLGKRRRTLFGLRPDPALWRLVREQGLSGDALDLGAGDGRHAVFLARHGFRVEAVDISAQAVRHLAELARRGRLPISARHADIARPGAIRGRYDLIVADTVLGHLEPVEAERMAGEVVDALRPGGRLFVTALGDADPRESEFAGLSWTYYSRAQLLALFADLRTERIEELDVTDRSHGAPHRHRLLRLIARKEDA